MRVITTFQEEGRDLLGSVHADVTHVIVDCENRIETVVAKGLSFVTFKPW